MTTKLGHPSNVYVCNSPTIKLEAEFSTKYSRRLRISLSVSGTVAVSWDTTSNHWTVEKMNQSVISFCKWMHSMSENVFLERTEADIQMQALYAHRMLREVFTVAGKKLYERA